MAGQRRYKLQYLPLFWDDLNGTVSYVADVLHEPEAAGRLLDRCERGILEYLKSPTAAAVYRSTRERPYPYYWFAVGNYMVFYVVIGDVMEVRRLIYGARDLSRML
jgi:plasmid stabilization system protein ParE